MHAFSRSELLLSTKGIETLKKETYCYFWTWWCWKLYC